MSLTTLTPDALRSEFRSFSGHCWRLVESQYVVSTFQLVDSQDEHDRLEELLDRKKPPVPHGLEHLHYLLYTPFRYKPAADGTRFRRKGQREGAFYSAEQVETSVAEVCFWRVVFFAESPEAKIPQGFGDWTAFSVSVATDAMVDITNDAAPGLRNLADYSATQAFADQVREAGGTGIRAISARCPNKGVTVTWLSASVFTQSYPIALQSWKIGIRHDGVLAIREFPKLTLRLKAEDLSADPRLANFDWSRAF